MDSESPARYYRAGLFFVRATRYYTSTTRQRHVRFRGYTMAARTRMIEDARVIDAESEDISHQIEQDNAEEAAIASEMGNADGDTLFTFTVHKHIPNSRQTEYCTEGTVADLPITPKLQENWGAGKYRVQIFKNGRFHKRYTLAVAAPPRLGRVTENPQPVTGNDPKLYELLDKLLAKADAPPPPPKTGLSPTEITALLMAAGPLIKTVKEIFAPPPQPNQLEMLQVAVNLVGGLRDNNSDREPNMLESIARIVTNPDVMGTLQNLIPAPAGAVERPALPSPAAPQAPTPEQIQQAQMAQVKQQLAALIRNAQKNSDPGLYAELIIDNYAPELVQQLTQPGAIDFILTLHPPCATYRPWFEALLTAIAEQLQEGGEGEASPNDPNPHAGASPVSKPHSTSRVVFDPQREPGNADDATPNGETGEGW